MNSISKLQEKACHTQDLQEYPRAAAGLVIIEAALLYCHYPLLYALQRTSQSNMEEVQSMVANGILLKETAKIRKIAFVGDHLPRKCGIATFTTDLLSAVQSAYPQSQCLCVSVNDIEDGYDYPEVVRFEIEEQDLPSYLRAADFLNISDVDIVCLQHEFGIFGGPAGGHVLAMLRELKMPVVTTLHTILRDPKPDQRRAMEELIALSTRLVVMADRGRQMLHEIYRRAAEQN